MECASGKCVLFPSACARVQGGGAGKINKSDWGNINTFFDHVEVRRDGLPRTLVLGIGLDRLAKAMQTTII